MYKLRGYLLVKMEKKKNKHANIILCTIYIEDIPLTLTKNFG